MATPNPQARDIVRFTDIDGLNRDAAYRVCALAARCEHAGKPFSIALTGGSSPGGFYRLLGTPPFRNTVNWSNCHLFFGDERCVPPEAEESNYRLARTTLLDNLPVPDANVHRMRGEVTDHNAAAREYEDDLRSFFAIEPGQVPRFDLILLGMGPDGHCASLFPHKPALHERDHLVIATEPGLQPFVTRITLTLPVINNAAEVLFLVPDGKKADIVARVLEGPLAPDDLPSQNVHPATGVVTWLLTDAAGAQLKTV